MLMKIWTGSLLFLAWLSFCAWLVLVCREKNVHPLRDFAAFFKKQTTVGRILFGTFFLIMWVYASVKPGDGGGNGGGDGGGDGGTNNVPQMVGPPGGSSQMSLPGGTLQPQAGLIGQHAGLQPVQPLTGGATLNLSGLNPITSTNTLRTITAEDFERGFVQTRVGIDEQFDFSPIANATIISDWRAFGAATDWIYVAFTNLAFQVATNDVERLRVYAFGKIEPLIRAADNSIATNYWFAPFMASLGVVPQANWNRLSESDRPSQVWYAITLENSLVITWQNALLDRDTDKPLSFQVEFETNGQFTYRYDLSRLNADTVTNILSGASFGGNEWTTNAIPTNVTSTVFYPLTEDDAYNQDPDNDGLLTIDELFFYDTDPRNPDTDFDGLTDYEELFIYNTNPLNPHSVSDTYCDGIAVKIGDIDPFSYPEGSTNTVLEHVFYSGTTNGVFAYPTSTVETAVLKIMVSGSGTGRLVIGDAVVPLIAQPPLRSGAQTNILFQTVERGVIKTFWWDKPDGLDVAVEADEFLIGELPSLWRLRGWIAFPHTDATVPCIHDFYAKGRMVTLVHGVEFPGLTAEWASEESGVAITNVPPVSAAIYGSFPKSATRTISYTLNHPNQLNSTAATFTQTLRFCPQLEDDDEPTGGSGGGGDEEPEYWNCECGWNGSCSCCAGEWCHCSSWDCPCNNNQSPTLDDNDEEEEETYTNIVNGVLSPLSDVLYLYRSNSRTENLPVPGGPPKKCCPCPEHWASNYVAKVSYSSRVAVRDAAGNDFNIAYEPCTVTVSGVSPSREFGDSTINFVTNGASYKRTDYTVLGVKFESMYGRASLSNYNHRSASLGYPVAICTNINNAGSIVMRTDVLLSDGVVRLKMEDISGDIALWLPEWWDSHGTWHPPERLLNAGDASTRYMTIRRWRNIMRRYNLTNAIEAKVVSSRSGTCKIKLEFVASNTEGYVHDIAEQKITTVMPVFFPDYNRDMRGNIDDALDQGNGRNLYFWSNRDTWCGDDAFAAYAEYNALLNPWPITLPSNNGDMLVNGRNDLVNLCPFVVNLTQLVHKWGTDSVRYMFYSGDPGNVRFVPVQTKWGALDAIVKENQETLVGGSLHSAELQTTSREEWRESGYALPTEFSSLGGLESGILAVEFATEGEKNIRVVVEDCNNSEVLFESQVVVQVLDVHNMYRWLNLEYVCNETTDPMYNDRLSVQWPDSEHADANVVFAHGYNMHPSEAWDWSQAMFKRLWWSGMDAGFTAVLWRGNESQLWISHKKCYATLNYHQNVLNAFLTAGAFASRVNGLPGAKKYMIAHSLGNMLVSSARQHHGLQYEQYFMLNAAVPVEAYDEQDGVSVASKHDMTPPEWRPYPDRVRSTHWFELPWHVLPFGTLDDARKGLTWKGLFKDVDNTVNFYSSRDEVVANGNDDVDELLAREFAWYNQEQAKGFLLVSLSPQAGWKFGDHYMVRIDTGNWENGAPVYDYRRYTPQETLTIADTNLMVRPFFRDFRDKEIYGEGGGDFVQTNAFTRWYALSHGIPTESYAVGANPVPKWETAGNNIDMAVYCNPAEKSNKPVKWVHSYFIGNSLFDTRKLYEELVKQIGSTKTKEEQANE